MIEICARAKALLKMHQVSSRRHFKNAQKQLQCAFFLDVATSCCKIYNLILDKDVDINVLVHNWNKKVNLEVLKDLYKSTIWLIKHC
jgi:hypothetical protein